MNSPFAFAARWVVVGITNVLIYILFPMRVPNGPGTLIHMRFQKERL